MIYFDTSALLPYYRQEAASRAVQQLLQSQTQPVLISDLTRVEVARALARTAALRTLDALHLACAAAGDAALVTLDDSLRAAAVSLGIRVHEFPAAR